MIRIYWRLFLKATTKAKARSYLNEVQSVLNQPVDVVLFDKSSEGPNCYEAVFWSSLDASPHNKEIAVYEMLQVAGRLADKWAMRVPQVYTTSCWDFEGISYGNLGRFKARGVYWAHFSLSTCSDDELSKDPGSPEITVECRS
jgi:hypothetical protein